MIIRQKRITRRLAAPLLTGALAGLAALAVPTVSAAQTQHLPIDSFLAVQPASQVQVWLDPATFNVLVFDAFGKRDAALGLNVNTSISGRITIRPHPEFPGFEVVTVVFQTRSAVCWGFAKGVPAFGRSPSQIAQGDQASIGDGMTRIEFTQFAGYPLPSWSQLGTSVYDLWSVTTTIICPDGELRLGSGFPDGTPGFAQTTQTGFPLGTPKRGSCPGIPFVSEDCFPAEKITFQATASTR